jgi:peptidoglycan/LPS O-acetylase OafA/YrhL
MHRNIQLDILRAIAILMVLTTHIFLLQKPAWWNAWAIGAGWAGVDLFFVLSGFLISRLLFSEYQKTRGIAYWRFAFRRGMKIWPPFFSVSVIYLVCGFVSSRPHRWFLVPFAHDILFMDSYVQGTFGHFWSLAVEEHFYILLPIVLYLMLRAVKPGSSDPFSRIPVLSFIVAIAVLGARIATHILRPQFSYFTNFFPTHLRIDSLQFGVLLGYFSQFHADRFWKFIQKRRWILLPVSFALISPCIIFGQTGDIIAPPNPFLYTFGFTSIYLGFGLLMVLFFQTPIPVTGVFGYLGRSMAGIGKYSYSIYLWHLPLILALQKYSMMKSHVALILYYVACILLGIAFAKLIEVPSLRLRDRLSNRSRGGEVVNLSHAEPAGIRTGND